jgi:hypothetical protein
LVRVDQFITVCLENLYRIVRLPGQEHYSPGMTHHHPDHHVLLIDWVQVQPGQYHTLGPFPGTIPPLHYGSAFTGNELGTVVVGDGWVQGKDQ